MMNVGGSVALNAIAAIGFYWHRGLINDQNKVFAMALKIVLSI